MSSSLGDHGWWELFADSCTGQSLDTSVNGHFSITALRDRKYFVRGNGICFMQAPCDSISISVSNPFFTVSIQDESLPGANDGEILMQNESGGFPPYEFSKNNGSTYKDGGLFSSLTPGTYSLRLKDSFGCETMDSIHSELYWTLSGSSTLYGFKTDSTGYVEFPISSIFSDELNFHDSLGKFYWLDEYNGRFLSSLDYDGSSLDSIYKTINYLRNFWTQSPSTKLFVQNYDEELLVGDLVSEVGLMKIAGPFSDDIADLEYDVEHDILYVIDEDNFVSCLQSDGGNFQTLASIDTLNFDLRYLSLDANNGRLYTCGRYLELGYFDLVNKEFHLIAYNDSIQVEEMVFDAHHQVFHFAVSEPIYSLLEYRLGQSEFKTLYEF